MGGSFAIKNIMPNDFCICGHRYMTKNKVSLCIPCQIMYGFLVKKRIDGFVWYEKTEKYPTSNLKKN